MVAESPERGIADGVHFTGKLHSPGIEAIVIPASFEQLIGVSAP